MKIDSAYAAHFAKTQDAVAAAILTLAEMVQSSAIGIQRLYRLSFKPHWQTLQDLDIHRRVQELLRSVAIDCRSDSQRGNDRHTHHSTGLDLLPRDWQ
jgi:hypothetical protein